METLRGVMGRSRLLSGTLDHSEFIGISAILHVDVPNRKQKSPVLSQSVSWSGNLTNKSIACKHILPCLIIANFSHSFYDNLIPRQATAEEPFRLCVKTNVGRLAPSLLAPSPKSIRPQSEVD